ncbi:hypothetical protein HK097_009837 [Rhizophlyctis rosea]|uniref:Uncharacterized protein n=1 Tax=Rhizophlyctis rosea TaxID=64517 RepID=A0AAD5SHN8_9FUNG|nr:hypothetical protein HK097_009837 [Rhizophlyctis rosea]
MVASATAEFEEIEANLYWIGLIETAKAKAGSRTGTRGQPRKGKQLDDASQNRQDDDKKRSSWEYRIPIAKEKTPFPFSGKSTKNTSTPSVKKDYTSLVASQQAVITNNVEAANALVTSTVAAQQAGNHQEVASDMDLEEQAQPAPLPESLLPAEAGAVYTSSVAQVNAALQTGDTEVNTQIASIYTTIVEVPEAVIETSVPTMKMTAQPTQVIMPSADMIAWEVSAAVAATSAANAAAAATTTVSVASPVASQVVSTVAAPTGRRVRFTTLTVDDASPGASQVVFTVAVPVTSQVAVPSATGQPTPAPPVLQMQIPEPRHFSITSELIMAMVDEWGDDVSSSTEDAEDCPESLPIETGIAKRQLEYAFAPVEPGPKPLNATKNKVKNLVQCHRTSTPVQGRTTIAAVETVVAARGREPLQRSMGRVDTRQRQPLRHAPPEPASARLRTRQPLHPSAFQNNIIAPVETAFAGRRRHRRQTGHIPKETEAFIAVRTSLASPLQSNIIAPVETSCTTIVLYRPVLITIPTAQNNTHIPTILPPVSTYEDAEEITLHVRLPHLPIFAIPIVPSTLINRNQNGIQLIPHQTFQPTFTRFYNAYYTARQKILPNHNTNRPPFLHRYRKHDYTSMHTRVGRGVGGVGMGFGMGLERVERMRKEREVRELREGLGLLRRLVGERGGERDVGQEERDEGRKEGQEGGRKGYRVEQMEEREDTTELIRRWVEEQAMRVERSARRREKERKSRESEVAKNKEREKQRRRKQDREEQEHHTQVHHHRQRHEIHVATPASSTAEAAIGRTPKIIPRRTPQSTPQHHQHHQSQTVTFSNVDVTVMAASADHRAGVAHLIKRKPSGADVPISRIESDGGAAAVAAERERLSNGEGGGRGKEKRRGQQHHHRHHRGGERKKGREGYKDEGVLTASLKRDNDEFVRGVASGGSVSCGGSGCACGQETWSENGN